MRALIIALAVCAAIAVLPYHARANSILPDHGLAGLIHKLGVENGQLCMTDHEHFGESGAWPTQDEARYHAVRSWSGFTRLEYGEVWANFELAADKGVECEPAITIRGDGWACSVKARPCKEAELGLSLK